MIDLGFDLSNIKFDDIPKVLSFLVKNVMELNRKVDKLTLDRKNCNGDVEAEESLAEITQKLERLEQLAGIDPEDNGDNWMNIQELCEYLPSHPAEQTIYGWTSNKKIPFHKAGKKVQFLQSEIDAWLLAKNTKEEPKTDDMIQDEVNEYIRRKKEEEKLKKMKRR